MKRSNVPVNAQKCGKCQGVPSQHNVRDATITIPQTGKTTPQHGFVFTGGN